MLAAAKNCKKTLDEAYPPRWFEKLPNAPSKGSKGKPGGVRYRYKGGYWEARKTGNFDASPDLFGQGPIPQPV